MLLKYEAFKMRVIVMPLSIEISLTINIVRGLALF